MEQAQARKDEWNQAKKGFIKNFTHGRKRRQELARATVLSPDERGGGVAGRDEERGECARAVCWCFYRVQMSGHGGRRMCCPNRGWANLDRPWLACGK